MSSHRLQELTVCTEDTVDVHDIELIQYINVDCSKLKRLLQGKACSIVYSALRNYSYPFIFFTFCYVAALC